MTVAQQSEAMLPALRCASDLRENLFADFRNRGGDFFRRQFQYGIGGVGKQDKNAGNPFIF
jgi:hypothetical protein